MKHAAFVVAIVASAIALGARGPFDSIEDRGSSVRLAQNKPGRFSVVEATIPQMQAAMAGGQVTSRQLVEQYLVRIAMYEDRLNAALAINARALDEADALDRERAQGRLRGPLHGIPVALKDNIHTTDMPTTGGALAFATVLHISPTAERKLDAVRALLLESGGASVIGERLTVRLLAPSGLALRRSLAPIIALLSPAGSIPRLWTL